PPAPPVVTVDGSPAPPVVTVDWPPSPPAPATSSSPRSNPPGPLQPTSAKAAIKLATSRTSKRGPSTARELTPVQATPQGPTASSKLLRTPEVRQVPGHGRGGGRLGVHR